MIKRSLSILLLLSFLLSALESCRLFHREHTPYNPTLYGRGKKPSQKLHDEMKSSGKKEIKDWKKTKKRNKKRMNRKTKHWIKSGEYE